VCYIRPQEEIVDRYRQLDRPIFRQRLIHHFSPSAKPTQTKTFTNYAGRPATAQCLRRPLRGG
jgi:hypothetical protein